MEGEEQALSSLATSAFSVLLRRYRLAADLSQEALAERARMSVEGISALERGVRRTPQRETLALLAQALELGPAERARFQAAVQRDRPLKEDRSSAVRPRHNLQLALTSFHSRERELADLCQLIATHRLVTLTGAGGIGKTRLALEAAFNLVADFADGVWFVELAPLGEGAFVASAIAQALGVREAPNQPLLATLLGDLKQQILVLILDNCEHVVEETARIANALLRGCPGVRIVATSREPLRVAGERSFRLPSLAFPTLEVARALCADEADAYGALALFVERAQAADHRFTLTDDSAPIVADICRRLDGIPLAIELAAARISILSTHQLRERLDERFLMLTGGSRAVLPRHQTLRALIDWSHDLLGEHERALFRRLSVFVNGFTLAGAGAVGSGEGLDEPDVFDVLASLVDKSLTQVEPDGEALRYRMLELTRAYAREKLEAAGELSASRSRHLRHMRDLFAASRMRVDQSGRSAEIDALLLAELEDVRVALDGVAGIAQQKMAAELLAAIDNRWRWIGLASEGVSRLERCISLMPAEERRLTSLLWTALARITTDNSTRAREAACIAVGLARDANDADALAQALTMYADSLARPGAALFEDAAAALTEAEALSAGNVWLRLRILRVRANLAAFLGDLDAAVQAYEQLRKTHLQLRNASEADNLTILLADVEHERGETERAVALVQEVLPALRAGRHRSAFLGALQLLCGYLVAIGRLSEARVVAREIFQSDQHDRDETNVPSAIEHLALAIALDDDVRRGAQLAGYSEAALQRIGFQREYTEHTTRTRLDALLQERLALAELNVLLAQGAALSEEDAVALVLASWPRREALLACFR